MKRRILAVLGQGGRSLIRRSMHLWLGEVSATGRCERRSGCPFVDDLGLRSLTHR